MLDVLAGNGTINGQMSIPYYDDGLDYNLYWGVLNTKNFGVPQNRERVFIVGFREHLLAADGLRVGATDSGGQGGGPPGASVGA